MRMIARVRTDLAAIAQRLRMAADVAERGKDLAQPGLSGRTQERLPMNLRALAGDVERVVQDLEHT